MIQDIRSRHLLFHEIFSFHASQTPEKDAVIHPEKRLTYQELEERSNLVAHVLYEMGIGPGSYIGIFMERSPELVVAQLGILKAGAAFAALDPAYPKDALQHVLQTAPLTRVITLRRFAAGFPDQSLQILCLDEMDWLENKRVIPSLSHATPDDPALLLFTSGSTGRPKAVVHTHGSIASRFASTSMLSEFTRDSVFAQISPLSSIDAIDELLVPLYTGGQTLILPYETVVNPCELIVRLDKECVSHIMLVPSLLRVLLSVDKISSLADLEVCLIGGEALHASLAEQFYQKLPSARLINFYGLTEGDVSYHEVSKFREYSKFVPVGHPIQNATVCLVSEKNEIIPVGDIGEICVGGDGLFREYIGRADLNSERWIANPTTSADTHPRLFKTGDLGRARADGEIEYVGRKDRMVKIRGFRVELGEIEAALLSHPDVRECAVVAYPNGHSNDGISDNHLIAYVVPGHGKSIQPTKIMSFATNSLPDFAVPSMIMPIEEMPLSPNGKVDLQKLPTPVSASLPGRDQDMDSPRNFVELELAAMWERLLHHSPVKVHDNFFEVGGDSLIAIELMLEIEKKYKRQLPISVLMHAPTICALAEILAGKDTQQWTSLVPIRTDGTQHPLFCIHADGGVLFYYTFAKIMDRKIPIYGLQARGLLGRNDQPLSRIEEMAAHYIKELQTIQPHGPYRLCGYSSGGFIIFEMARQLKAKGEQVGLVGMLDAYGPNYPQIRQDKNVASYKLSVHLNALKMYGPVDQLKYLWERTWKRLVYIFSGAVQKIFQLLHLPLPHRIRYNQVARLVNRAETLYQPKKYDGDIILFRASVQPDNIVPDEFLGWRNYVSGNIEIHEIPGTHNSIMHEPQGMVLALQSHLT